MFGQCAYCGQSLTTDHICPNQPHKLTTTGRNAMIQASEKMMVKIEVDGYKPEFVELTPQPPSGGEGEE